MSAEEKVETKTEQILSEIKRRRDQNNVIRVEEEKIKLVIFSLRDDYYAFYGKQVKEILRFREITYVPGCPNYIMGIINVRGDIESVLNLHLMMGIPETEQTRTSRIMITEKDGVRSGVLADMVLDVIDVPVGTIKPPVSTIAPEIKEFTIGGETIYNEKYVTVLDIGKIFNKISN